MAAGPAGCHHARAMLLGGANFLSVYSTLAAHGYGAERRLRAAGRGAAAGLGGAAAGRRGGRRRAWQNFARARRRRARAAGRGRWEQRSASSASAGWGLSRARRCKERTFANT
ncbi:unnamed protein product [Prorocentrum cordatum]|uniref:Uncharacterized protein n=1 Tax=Prorocentrum cordatum TaxID=2364126 RepID=A0ABN9XSP0_9DINO|nr:unnamed protein product [Polarella glacialis]